LTLKPALWLQTLKRRTKPESQELEQEITAKDIAGGPGYHVWGTADSGRPAPATDPSSPPFSRPDTKPRIPLHAADTVARQMNIEIVPELLDFASGDTLYIVGEYRLPLKLVLPSGERAMLDVNVLST
jgi:hypothetical protein